MCCAARNSDRTAGGCPELKRAPAGRGGLLTPHVSPALAAPQIESGGVTHEHTRKWLYLQELQVGAVSVPVVGWAGGWAALG